MTPRKIVSSGQTGAERAALDWAHRHDIPHGGWCPPNRIAEDGLIPPRYALSETLTESALECIEWNTRDSDATVIITLSPALPLGSRHTVAFTKKHGKPCLHLSQFGAPELKTKAALLDFVSRHTVRCLHVSGTRISKEPRFPVFVTRLLNILTA